MSSWVASFPPGRDRWEVLSALAAERSVLPHILLQEVRMAGAAPACIGGVWMVRRSEWERVQPLLRSPGPAAAISVDVSTAAVPPNNDHVTQALERQAAALEQLRAQITALSRRLAVEESNS